MSISVTGLTKAFGSERAVDNVSFEVAENEFFAIVGPSGCGKSTLLRLLAGLEEPTSGTIHLNGREVAGPKGNLPPEDRKTGFVFQSYALWPHLTVQGNVAFPAEAQGASRSEATKVARANLETVALLDLADRKPEALSGGQRQRVALARCLAGGAQVVLMDEPLANLDPHLRTTMERELARFHRRAGTTTVYITHDQREAMALADRMAVMQSGRFLQIGAPSDIFDRPETETVARFIGRGTILTAPYADGHVHLLDQAVRVSALKDHATGPAKVLFRPDDIKLSNPGGLNATVKEAHYRGGAWEGSAQVEGLSAPFEVTSRTPLREGDKVGVTVTGGWVLPG